MTAPTSHLVSIADAAAYAAVSVKTIRRRIEDGTLHARHNGRRLIRVDLADVDAMFSEIPTTKGLRGPAITRDTGPAVETTTCVLVRCYGCGQYDEHYEYETPVHWPSLEVAVQELTRDDDGIENRWAYDSATQTLTCPRCLATARCEVAGGHDWSAWGGWGPKLFRYCQRDACETRETKAVETGAPL